MTITTIITKTTNAQIHPLLDEEGSGTFSPCDAPDAPLPVPAFSEPVVDPGLNSGEPPLPPELLDEEELLFELLEEELPPDELELLPEPPDVTE